MLPASSASSQYETHPCAFETPPNLEKGGHALVHRGQRAPCLRRQCSPQLLCEGLRLCVLSVLAANLDAACVERFRELWGLRALWGIENGRVFVVD